LGYLSAQPDPNGFNLDGWVESSPIYLIIILKYLKIKKKKKKNSNFPNSILKFFVGSSHVFPTILYNYQVVDLNCIYIVRYIPDIKNIWFPPKLKKNPKNSKFKK